MAYTNSWNDDDVLGSEAAKNIDDEFRRLKLDIHERMNDVVVDWTTDPVVPKAGTGGGGGGSGIVVGFPAFIAHSSAFYGTYLTDHVQCPSTSVMNAPLMLQAGNTIKNIKWLVDKGIANVSITMSLVSISFDILLVPTVWSTITQSSTGLNLLTSADLGLGVGQNENFYLQVTCIGSNPFKIYGVQVNT